MENKKLKILLVTFDWRNIFETDFDQLKGKLSRDRLGLDTNDVFIFAWSNKTYQQKKDNIETCHVIARFKHFRIIYDLLLIIYLPYVIWRSRFKPDVIWFRDFPFVFGSIIPRCFGTKIALFLGTMPRTLVKTKKFSFAQTFYQRFSEFISKFFIDYYIANGQATKGYLVNLGINQHKIKIMTEDVIRRDQSLILEAKQGYVRQKYGINTTQKIILCVARLEPEKGHNVY